LACVVHVKAVRPVPEPMTLAAVKAEPKLKDMALVKYSRLSVQPVRAQEWAFGCKMGKPERGLISPPITTLSQPLPVWRRAR
jgi:predicted RNA-binding protein with PUA-like domain